jgi:co-chaperonin GroES (HSP10)
VETFPIRPLFDRVIVREIPIEDYYEQSDTVGPNGERVVMDLANANIKERSDRGVVVAAGKQVQEVVIGDTVQFDEYCLTDPIYLNPAHKNRHDLPRYWQIRVPDLKGVRIAVFDLESLDCVRA